MKKTDGTTAMASPGLTLGGVFSGIGGFELGFHKSGFATQFLCEIDDDANRVLEERFAGATLYRDIVQMERLPRVDVLIGGFPCQDLSAVGTRLGLAGARSSLVNTLFDLVGNARVRPDWLVLENVPFMLQLHGGRAIEAIVRKLEGLGYRWAYRVVNSRAFGLPQRRRRVFIVATRTDERPENVLFADDAAEPKVRSSKKLARGFYWTEGNTGVGWAIDAIPTLKGGSGLSIPSPPAIWMPATGRIQLPEIRDAERLQGFDEDWTIPTAMGNERHGRRRWRQVGNAVSVPAAQWIAQRIAAPGEFDESILVPMLNNGKWPMAACGSGGKRYAATVSEYPLPAPEIHLHKFLKYRGTAISPRAANGFFQRVRRTTLKLEDGFLSALAVAAGLDPSEAVRVPKIRDSESDTTTESGLLTKKRAA